MKDDERLGGGCQPTENKSAVPESPPLSLRLTTAQETSSSAGINLPGGRGWARTVSWVKETVSLLRLYSPVSQGSGTADAILLCLYWALVSSPTRRRRFPSRPAFPNPADTRNRAQLCSGRRVSCLNCCGSHFMSGVGWQVHGAYSTHWTQRSLLSASDRTGALIYSYCLRLTCAFSVAAANSS